MPTAGRLAGGVIFGLFGWYFAGLATPYFPEGRPPEWFIPTAALVSLFIGWKLCGKRAGRGYNPAIGVGLTAGATIAFALLFILSIVQMVKNSMRLRYDGPTEAVMDTFSLMLENAQDFYSAELILTLAIGGIVCAWITEFFGQRYP